MNSVPSFERNVKGKYIEEANFISIQSGSDAYLLEDEINEMQWLNIENNNKEAQLLYFPGVVSPKSDSPFTVSENDYIHISQLNVYYYGFNITIPEQDIQVTTPKMPDTSSIRTDCLFAEVWFKKISEDTKTVRPYGNYNQLASDELDVEIEDTRLNYPTSCRVQIQTKYMISELVNSNPVGMTGTYGTIKIDDNKLWQQLPFANALDVYIEDVPTTHIDYDNIINHKCAVFPICSIARTNHDIQQSEVTSMLQEPVSTIADYRGEIEDLYSKFMALTTRINNLETEVTDDQKAYGISMEKIAAFYTGYDTTGTNMYVGTPIKATNFALTNNTFVYALTNLGNHYTGQIGELWTYWDNNTSVNEQKFYVCNTGCKNAMFHAWLFDKDNEELYWTNTVTAGNNAYTEINGANTIMADWDINKCIVYIIPQYTYNNRPQTTPSIGDIYWSLENTSATKFGQTKIHIYNTGISDIPLQVFVLNIKSPNIDLINIELNDSTTIIDNYGKHHCITRTDMTYGHTSVLVSTPYVKEAPTDINVGEIYIEQNDNIFMLNTTSYGDADINLAVFKTVYHVQGGE